MLSASACSLVAWPASRTASASSRAAAAAPSVADVTPLIPHPGAAAEFKRLEALEREGDPAFEAPAAEITKQAGRKGGKTDKTDA